jgi:hypothetical protein
MIRYTSVYNSRRWGPNHDLTKAAREIAKYIADNGPAEASRSRPMRSNAPKSAPNAETAGIY